MKKIIIIAIALMLMATGTSAVYFDDALVNLWNSRPDLQRAFPGNPAGNTKLEAWAKKYGWKENSDLYNFYPDRAVVEKIVDSKTSDRIKLLENQVAELTARINNLQPSQISLIAQKEEVSGTWRDCLLSSQPGSGYSSLNCKTTEKDWPVYDNGRFYIKVMTK